MWLSCIPNTSATIKPTYTAPTSSRLRLDDAVVRGLLERARAAQLPPPPGLHHAERRNTSRNGLPTSTSSATRPPARRTTPPAPLPPSLGHHRTAPPGIRLIRLRKKPTYASARRRSLLRASARARQPAAPAVPRTGPRAPRAPRRARALPKRLGHTTAPKNGYEHRRARLQALAAQLDHMAELVHEQQHHEPDRERPPPEQRVRGHGHERRAGRREQLDLGQQQDEAFDRGEELGHQCGERRECSADPSPQPRPGSPLARERSPNGSPPGAGSAAGAVAAGAGRAPGAARVRGATAHRCPCIHCGSALKRRLTPTSSRAVRRERVGPPNLLGRSGVVSRAGLHSPARLV